MVNDGPHQTREEVRTILVVEEREWVDQEQQAHLTKKQC